jgi:hypothetical protein
MLFWFTVHSIQHPHSACQTNFLRTFPDSLLPDIATKFSETADTNIKECYTNLQCLVMNLSTRPSKAQQSALLYECACNATNIMSNSLMH